MSMIEPRLGASLPRRALLSGLAAGVAGGLALAALPRPLAAAPLARVKELGTLRVGVYADNRPWSWNDGGTLRGIDVDLAKALADKLGVRADIAEFMAGDDLAADLRNVVWRGGLLGFRPCDVMMHVPFDRELQIHNDQVAILAPYYREGFAMLCAAEVADCNAPPAAFKGLRLTAETASVADAYLLEGFGGVLRGDVRHFSSGYAAAAAVTGGSADVVLATRAEVEAAAHDAPGAPLHRRTAPIPAMASPGWDLAMAVKDSSRTLGDAIEGLVATMIAQHQLDAVFATYGVAWHPALAG